MLNRILLIFLFSLIVKEGNSQVILNGDFEINIADSNIINMFGYQVDSVLSDVYSFGDSFNFNIYGGNIDLIRDPDYCNTISFSGDWFVALTGGGTDQLALELSSTLHSGMQYTLHFSDRRCDDFWTPVETIIGISNSSGYFGDTIFVGPIVPSDTNWHNRSFTFTSSLNAKYITIKLGGFQSVSQHWQFIDNLYFENAINLNLGNDTILCEGESLVLNAEINNASYLWSDGSNSSDYIVNSEGVYWVVVEDSAGLITSDSITIKYQDCSINIELPKIEIPNVFSPNNDGINDIFLPIYFDNLVSYEMLIYNRWGQVLFISEDQNIGWNGIEKGKNAADGVYFYYINYSGPDDEVRKKQGFFHLVK